MRLPVKFASITAACFLLFLLLLLPARAGFWLWLSYIGMAIVMLTAAVRTGF